MKSSHRGGGGAPITSDDDPTYPQNRSVKNDGSYVLVDELWDNSTRTFNKDNVNTLLKYMGLDGKTLTEISTLATSTQNASDFRAVEVAGKTSSQDINVMLGGLEWTVCYLSQDNSGNPTLTLWLSNSTQDAFAGRSQTEGEYYGYITDSLGTGIYSAWNVYALSNDSSVSYPSNMYGTSYIRAVTLNNGGKYALSGGETLSAEVEQDSNSAFALFTMSTNSDGKDLVNYILTPSEMSWQESGQNVQQNLGLTYQTSNNNWGVENDAGYYSTSHNYSSKSGYDTWKNDKLWIPSLIETGYNNNNGIWKINANQRENYDGKSGQINDSDSGVIYYGRAGTTSQPIPYPYTMLRSVHYCNTDWFDDIRTTGNSYSNDIVAGGALAVRPALHLNLSSLLPTTRVTFEANGGNCSTTNVVLYANDTYGTLPTPTKTGYKFKGWFLDEALTQPVTSETVVTNSENHTLYAKWGDLVEYKTYYDYFIDNMDCTGVYDTDGNLTNVTISDEKKAEILANDFTGSGTSTDPYQVNSSLGFWFMSKFVTLSNKYVELNCDVILNDETFDENGNVLVNENGEPIYGDGIVYQWNFVSVCNKMSFYGQNHYITGLYINKENQTHCTLFCEGNSGYIALFDSLEITNAFLKGDKNVCAFGYAIDDISNCKLTNSTLIANEEYCAGLAFGVKRANNCYNLASIKSKLYAGGLFIIVYDKISNCENYGEINAYHVGGITELVAKNTQIINCKNFGNINYIDRNNNWCGGIVRSFSTNVIIENCENHGNIYGGRNLGGMTAFCEIGGLVKIINCANYGDVISEETSNSFTLSCCVAGCQLYNGANVIIDGYKNYGAFYRNYSPDTCASLFGQVSYDSSSFERTIKNMLTIKNCYLEVDKLKSNGAVFINHMNLGKNLDVRITNNHVKAFNLKNNSDVSLLGGTVYVNSLELSNLVIDLEGNSSKVTVLTGGLVAGYGNISVKNIIINANSGIVTTNWKHMTKSTFEYSQNGILINGENQKEYYGSSFRDFYVSWRTGKIGLNALDGVGIFQGRVTEEWLKEKGFEKKN